MTPEQAAALRAPFPPEQIGQIPKGGVLLDYVGHAATTDRLLQVDPEWYWEPLGVDAYGLPKLDDAGNLWIKLHVAGTVTIGVGDGPNMKERVGDAVRNASMRRGVALDLWSKEPLPQGDETVTKPKRATRHKPTKPVDDEWSVDPADAGEGVEPGPPSVAAPSPAPPRTGGMAPPITAGQVKLINVLADGAGITDRAVLHEGISKIVGREVNSVKALTKPEAVKVIEALQARQPAA